MKDLDNLKQHNIKDGLTIHLVIRAAPRQQESGPQRPPADINATPFSLGSLGGLPGLEQLGMGSSSFMEMQNRMQNELLSNPDMLRQVLDNPLVQRLMNDPEDMRAFLTRNPQMQELMERNPEINHMLNNPELLRQTMELARNPSMLQELMRSHDRAISNLESIPGGYNALQRMYRDIQEPMLSATAEQFSRNPFAGLVDNTSVNNPQQGTENREPLPNPWGGGGGPRTGTTTTTTNTTNTTTPGRNVLNNAAMSSLIQQMSENPQLMQSMLMAPSTQNILGQLTANPNMASSILAENPVIAQNPVLQDQMRNMMPQIIEQLRNPDIQNIMANPQALNAILQIHQGMETLRQTAPSFINTFPTTNPLSTTTSSTTTTTTTTTNTNATTSTTNTNTTTQSATTTAQSPVDPFAEVNKNIVRIFII